MQRHSIAQQHNGAADEFQNRRLYRYFSSIYSLCVCTFVCCSQNSHLVFWFCDFFLFNFFFLSIHTTFDDLLKAKTFVTRQQTHLQRTYLVFAHNTNVYFSAWCFFFVALYSRCSVLHSCLFIIFFYFYACVLVGPAHTHIHRTSASYSSNTQIQPIKTIAVILCTTHTYKCPKQQQRQRQR